MTNLLILSAGLGTRLRPITNKIPKPALPILNIPMLLWNYFYFKNKSIKNCVVNTFHLEEVLRTHFSNTEPKFIFSSDGKEVLGTGGGIANNKDLLFSSDYFWVVNGDGFFLTNPDFVEKAESLHKASNALATLVVCEHPDVGIKFGGVWVDRNSNILSIGKKKPAEAVKGYHFTGFRVLSNKIFNFLPAQGPNELFDTLNDCIQQKQIIKFLNVQGEFFETGNKIDFLNTNQASINHLKSGPYSKLIQDILKTYSPHSQLNPHEFMMKFPQTKNAKDIFCDEKLRIFEGTQLAGFFISGKNVSARENCQFENVVVLADQDIPPNSSYKDEVIF